MAEKPSLLGGAAELKLAPAGKSAPNIFVFEN